MRCRYFKSCTTSECLTLLATTAIIFTCITVVYRTFLNDIIFAENRYYFLERYETSVQSTASKLLSLDETGYSFAEEQSYITISKSHHFNNEVKKSDAEIENETHYISIDNSIIEHNPRIDDNLPPDSYKWYLKDQQFSVDCNLQIPVKRLVYFRSHRTGSHTLSNIFYRYGDVNNLYFALSNAPTFRHYWPLRFHHTFVDKSLLNKVLPDFVIGVGRTRVPRMKSFVPRETVFIAVVRNPVDHFQSLYEYIDISFFMALISNGTDLFSEFASNPLEKTLLFVNETKQYDPIFDLIKNPQLFDLGFEKRDYKTNLDLKFIIRELEEQLDFVLVNEYMDESLVLLQRRMCWQLSDVIYFKQRVRKTRQAVLEKTKEDIRRWNKEDEFLYKHFNESLWKTLHKQDKAFWDDVKKLKKISAQLKHQCTETEDEIKHSKKENKLVIGSPFKAKESIFEEVIYPRQHVEQELKWLCERMLLSEREYVALLKTKQRQVLMKENAKLWQKSYFENKNENKHFNYPLKNTEEKIIEDEQASPPKEEVEEENSEFLLR